MRTSKKIVSLVLAVLMVATMMVVGTVSVFAATKADLQAAFNAGGNVVLDSDCTFTGRLNVPAGKTVVLDLNGHQLKSSNSYAIYNNGGTLTINDSVGTGSVYAREACVTAWGPNATTTINGGTFTSEDNGVLMCNGTAKYAGCTWYINDGTFNAYIESNGYIAMGIYAPNNDVWNVNGGTFNVTNGCGICQRAGVVNVADGVVFNVTGDGHKGHTGDSRIVVPTGTAIVYDSQSAYPAQDANAQTNVEGGTFNTDQTPVVQVKADGDATRVEVTGGSFDTAPAAEFVTGTTITDGTRTYVGYDGFINSEADLATAIATGGKWAVGTDFTITTTDANPTDIPASTDLTIDLNGHTVTVTPWGFTNHGTLTVIGEGKMTAAKGVIDNYGVLNLKGGTIESTGPGVAIWNNDGTNASIVVEGGDVNAASVAFKNEDTCSFTLNRGNITAGNYGVVNIGDVEVNGGSIIATEVESTGIDNSGKVVVNDGQISSGQDGWGIATWSDTEVVVNGGTITGGYAISGNGNHTNYKITVNDGYVKGDDLGIYNPGDGTVVINGGTVEGASGIYSKAGSVTVNAGTIKGTGEKKDYTYYGNGGKPTGDAIVIDNCSYPSGVPAVSITGGNFESDNAEAVGSYANGVDAQQNENAPVNNFIEGGTFSSDVSDLAVTGKMAESNGGVYTIVTDSNPLTAGGNDIKGFEQKIDTTIESTGDGNDINAAGIRIWTKFDKAAVGAEKYGYVVAAYSGDKTVDTLNFDALTIGAGNGEKTIDCTDSTNNTKGNDYVTLAVNGIAQGQKVVARFWATVNGVTYYSNYVSTFGNADGGILAVA